MTTPATAYRGTQSVVRALRLLKLFHSASPELSLAELRERSGLNRSTVFRLLTALQAEGMVVRDPATDGYRLGPQVAALGRRAGGTGDLRALATPAMQALARATEETVTLEALAGPDVRVLAEATGGHVLGALPSVGETWPAHATSTGKVLLAALDARERTALLRRRRHACTPRTLVAREDLEADLARVARLGYALSLEELEPGYVAAAVPVRDADGGVVAALAVGGPKHRLRRRDLEGLVPDLQRTAREVRAQLGG